VTRIKAHDLFFVEDLIFHPYNASVHPIFYPKMRPGIQVPLQGFDHRRLVTYIKAGAAVPEKAR
jgi:hypothetical protein